MKEKLFSKREIESNGFNHICTHYDKKSNEYDCYFFNPVSNILQFFKRIGKARKYIFMDEFEDTDMFINFIILKHDSGFYLFGSWADVEISILKEKLKYLGIKNYYIDSLGVKLRDGEVTDVHAEIVCPARLRFLDIADESAFLFYFNDKIKTISKTWLEV